ncbi:MAG: ABC transporter permease [Candidatus Thorarchaeota archaeon]
MGSLKHRKLRAWLTMLGIFVGIAAVVSLISLGQGLQEAINEEFEKMGTNKIMIEPGAISFGPPGTSTSSSVLTEDDVKVIERVKGVDLVARMLYKSTKTEFHNDVKYTFVIGMPTDETKEVFEEMQSVEIAEGRNLQSSDRNKVVIGSLIAEGDMYDREVRLRDRIAINEKEFKVVGIFKPVGNPQDDKQMYIPYDAAIDLFDIEDEIDILIVQTIEGIDVAEVAESIKKDLRDYRDVDEGEEDFRVQTFEQVMDSFNTIFGIVQAVVIGIAAISLIVGGLGITNTMYTSVLERTRDIGIMKAIGARNSDIMKLFLIESGMLGLVGGAIGILIGVGLSKIVEIAITQLYGFYYLKAHFPWYLILGALAFSFLVGSLSGVMPARQAAKMKPVDALRYE